MKTWNTPSMNTLDINETAQGKKISTNFDEIRVDQNGNYWAGFQSGEDSKPETDGDVIVQ